MTAPSILFIGLLSLYGVHCTTIEKDRLSTYRVAVFEYNVVSIPVQTTTGALLLMKENLAVYNQTAITARLKGAKMLVFPEYGITGLQLTQSSISNFAEIIPDPKIYNVNPCINQRYKNQDTMVQWLLSCIARENEIFIVANMAGREGQYFYNTNVVFSPKGQLIARYYKTHLYGEDWFNPANQAEVVTFDTPFGKFGTFICFDVMFKNPAIEAIEKYNVHNFVTPVAWVKTPPLFRSIQMHSSFARGQKINFLVSNVHSTMSNSYGSGIYTPKGAVTYYYRPDIAEGSRLLLADIHSLDYNKRNMSKSHFDDSQEIETKDYDDAISSVSDDFVFKQLTNQSGSITVCHNSFCCKTSYQTRKPLQEKYAVVAYSGYINEVGNKLYAQMCSVLKCAFDGCGKEIHNVQTEFSHISLQGIGFSTKYIYPSILAMDTFRYVLVPFTWTYSKGKGIESRPRKIINLHSATLIGRVYSKDILVRDDTVESKKTRPKKSTFYQWLALGKRLIRGWLFQMRQFVDFGFF